MRPLAMLVSAVLVEAHITFVDMMPLVAATGCRGDNERTGDRSRECEKDCFSLHKQVVIWISNNISKRKSQSIHRLATVGFFHSFGKSE